MVAEGSGHCLDSFQTLEESGLAEVLAEDRVRFFDLNHGDIFLTPNLSRQCPTQKVDAPQECQEVVGSLHAENEDSSLGRRNTLHEKHVRCNAGQLLWLAQERSSYGWNSKSNLGHQRLRENKLAIVDGIVGMEGDGPIIGGGS